MLKIQLTETQAENLKIFLSRVDLKGGEVPAYVEIVNQLNSATKEE